MKNLSSSLGAIAIGLGIAIAGYFISQTMLNQRTGSNTARVKGLSERIVPADSASWNLSYSVTSRDYDAIGDTFATATANRDAINAVLAKAGFDASEVNLSPLRKRDHVERGVERQIIDRYYSVNGTVTISTTDPAKIEPARAPVFLLAQDGITVQEQYLDYRFTKLNEIKPEMLREATENARIAANEFASNAGVKVGGIQTASQGGFQINDAETGSFGLDKMVRVVTNITFYLEND